MRWILVLAVAACSSGKVTSLDGDLVISTLSKDEAKQLCEDLDSWARSHRVALHREYRCVLQSLDPDNLDLKATHDYEVQESCHRWRDDCIRKAADKPEPPPLDCKDFMADFDHCKGLTVAEFDACTRESLEQEKQDVAEDWCMRVSKRFTRDDHIKAIDDHEHPGPACLRMRDKCPKR